MRGVESQVPQLNGTGEFGPPTDPAPRELSTAHTPNAMPPGVSTTARAFRIRMGGQEDRRLTQIAEINAGAEASVKKGGPLMNAHAR